MSGSFLTGENWSYRSKKEVRRFQIVLRSILHDMCSLTYICLVKISKQVSDR